MKMYTTNLLVVVFLLSMCQLTLSHRFMSGKWDHFMFAQAWPPGTCADAPRGHHSCFIAMKVDTWTIHGLWPSLGDEKGPVSCNSSWTFDPTKVAKLWDQLDTYWPNLYNDTSHYSFWSHEWSKHGTCCADLTTTSGEEKYFQAGLVLNKKYNISQMLRQNGVVPSDTAQYSYDEFIGAVKKAIGVSPVLQCAYKKLKNGTGYHLIDQIQICLNKDFSPISCDFGYYPIKLSDTKLKYETATGDIEQGDWFDPQSSCSKTKKFNYPPIHSELLYN